MSVLKLSYPPVPLIGMGLGVFAWCYPRISSNLHYISSELWIHSSWLCISLHIPFWFGFFYLFNPKQPHNPPTSPDSTQRTNAKITKVHLYLSAMPVLLFVTGLFSTSKLMETLVKDPENSFSGSLILVCSSSLATLVMGILLLLSVVSILAQYDQGAYVKKRALVVVWLLVMMFVTIVSFLANFVKNSQEIATNPECGEIETHWALGQALQGWFLLWVLILGLHRLSHSENFMLIKLLVALDTLIGFPLQALFFYRSVLMVTGGKIIKCNENVIAAMISVQIAGWLLLPRIAIVCFFVSKSIFGFAQRIYLLTFRVYVYFQSIYFTQRKLMHKNYERLTAMQKIQLGFVANPCEAFLVEELPDNIRNYESCAICMEDFDNMKEKVCYWRDCYHIFHQQCLAKWTKINQICPICKRVA